MRRSVPAGLAAVLVLCAAVALAQDSKPAPAVAEPAADAAPVYVPPKRGGPANVAAAATRSGLTDALKLRLLAPNHTGLTVAEQPTLYMYAAEPGAVRVRVMRTASLSDPPIATGSVEVKAAPAIVAVALKDLKANLRAGTEYEVVVSMYDSASGAVKGTDSAMIQRVAAPAGLAARPSDSPLARARAYASAGLWFDAIGALGEAAAAQPASPGPRGHRAALLDQAGLKALAEFDRKGPGG
ncbi:MAG: DUF928 domain-containing protein [Rhodospirillales bacterium]